MKLRCRTCGARLGLGTVTRTVWERPQWAFRTYRFCGSRCVEIFKEARRASLNRVKAVHQLFRLP
jgi:hypothetical protein